MFKTVANIFKIPDIRKKALFTIGMLLLCRIGVQIPVPGVNLVNLPGFQGLPEGATSFWQILGSLFRTTGTPGTGSDLMDFINLFTGGGLERVSIFSLGVMPYITAMIIMQLLTAVVPAIDKMLKEGPEGRKKFQQYGRLGTVLVTLVQGFIFGQNLVVSNRAAATKFLTVPDWTFLIIFVVSVTAGTLIMMWIGEQITERGVGNGISLLIMIGIVAQMPMAIVQMFRIDLDPMSLFLVLALFIGVIGLVTFEEQGLRKIPVQYAKRFVAGGNYGAQVSFLPFKVNPTGVIPIIFASAILIFPAQLAQWFPDADWLRWVSDRMRPGMALYSVVYFLMILFFAYFYMEIELNPHDIAENLRKQGGFIPGIRPGSKTEEYISFVLHRITLPGAMFLGTIALLPYFVISALGIPQSLGYLMGGTSLLIMVGVALDTLRQLDSHLVMHHVDGFFTKKKSVKL
jgi:preprotein translocase subunit SecY